MKKIFLLFIALIATTTVWAEDYITDVMVIGGSKSETNALKASYTAQAPTTQPSTASCWAINLMHNSQCIMHNMAESGGD